MQLSEIKKGFCVIFQSWAGQVVLIMLDETTPQGYIFFKFPATGGVWKNNFTFRVTNGGSLGIHYRIFVNIITPVRQTSGTVHG